MQPPRSLRRNAADREGKGLRVPRSERDLLPDPERCYPRLREAGSDGIIQASTGGAAYWSGASKKDMVVGSLAFAAYAREVAKQYDVNIALHTDHCPKDKLEGFVLPLLAESEKAVARGEDPIFNSHMGRLRNRPG